MRFLKNCVTANMDHPKPLTDTVCTLMSKIVKYSSNVLFMVEICNELKIEIKIALLMARLFFSSIFI
jgi:hypothetical protein